VGSSKTSAKTAECFSSKFQFPKEIMDNYNRQNRVSLKKFTELMCQNRNAGFIEFPITKVYISLFSPKAQHISMGLWRSTAALWIPNPVVVGSNPASLILLLLALSAPG
jgi:hypothetical protein